MRDIQRDIGDLQIIVAVAAGVGAAGGGYIDNKHLSTGLKVAHHITENIRIGIAVEHQRRRGIVGIRNGDRPDQIPAHRGDAPGDSAGGRTVEGQVLGLICAGLCEGDSKFKFADADMGLDEILYTVQHNRAFIS